MTTINSQLGLKPRTRTRQATHGTALADQWIHWRKYVNSETATRMKSCP
jgi:hypothetical protein